MLTVAFVLVTLYAVCMAGILFGLHRSGQCADLQRADLPVVSVVVAIRNEAARIRPLLENLLRLEYPAAHLEIIIVDDHSTDVSYAIAEEFVSNFPVLRVVRAAAESSFLNGKANALEQGIAQATGEFIFVTDADCRPPAAWIRGHLREYHAHTGMVGGFTLLTTAAKKSTLFAQLQSLDWLYMTAVGSGAAGLGIPLSIFGNNLSFRRVAFEQVGGFAGAGPSVIEDFALMQAMHAKYGWQIRLAPNADMLVQSEPVTSLRRFYTQRKRWAIGGRAVSLPAKVLMALGIAGRVFPLFLLLGNHPLAGLACLLSTVALDFLLVLSAAQRLRRQDQLRAFPLYPLFAAAYSLALLPAYLFGRSVQWKDRTYAT